MERPEIYSGRPGAMLSAVTSQVFIRADNHRKRVIITNDSDTVLYLRQGNNAVQNAGIPLYPYESLIDEPDQWGRMYYGEWSFICSVANKRICWSES